MSRADIRVMGIAISHPGRVVFDAPRVTKLDVARHYAASAGRILPFLRHRPLAMLRCPEGLAGPCFFQKHRPDGIDAAVAVVEVEGTDEREAYMTLVAARGLVAAAQMGVIEFHPWGARNDAPDLPDRLIFDLDPGAGAGFAEVRAAALAVRERLDALGLPSGPMLTGGRGAHVVVPPRRRARWAEARALSAALARDMAAAAPDRFVAGPSKAERAGHVFVDWLRNDRGATAVAPYSLRARPGAKVAVPLTWAEFAAAPGADAYDIHSLAARRETVCPAAALRRRAAVLTPAILQKAERLWPAG